MNEIKLDEASTVDGGSLWYHILSELFGFYEGFKAGCGDVCK